MEAIFRSISHEAALTLLASSALTGHALAQTAPTGPPPLHSNIDANGVDLATGAFRFSLTEGTIGSGEGAVSLERIWGEGTWRTNWSGALYLGTDGYYYVDFGSYSDSFSLSGSTYTSRKANGATLTGTSGFYTYTAADGTVIIFFDNDGGLPLSGFACPGGTQPGACALPSTITRPNGLAYTIAWGMAELSNTGFYRFEGVTSSAGYGFTINYLTDNPGHLAAPKSDWYVMTGVTFSNSVVTCDSSCPAVTYSSGAGGTDFVTDALGRTWQFNKTNGSLSGIRRPGETSDSTTVVYGGPNFAVSSVTRDGVTTGYSRSVSGTIATTIITDPLAHSRTIVADTALDRIKSVQDELGRTTSYQYDANGRPTLMTLPEGNYWQLAYDGRGNVTSMTAFPKSGSGLPNIVSSATFPSTCTNQKTCNQPASTTDPKGNVTDYTYDNTHGGLLTVTGPPPATGLTRPQTRYSYTSIASASGGPVYELTGVSACQSGTGCIGTSDEAKASIAYNSNLLPTSITRADGTGTLSVTDSSTYDPAGNTLTQDGPLSTADITRYRYDAARQLTGVMDPDPDGSGPLKIRAVQLTYRPDGQVSKQELGTITGSATPSWSTFAAAQTVDIGFDANSRPVTSKLSAGGTNYALTQISYDTLGRTDCSAVRMNTALYASLPAACSQATPQGSFGPDRISQTVYDAASQPTQLKVAVGTADAATERTLSYTDNGMLATLTDGENNKTTYVYDGFDRLSQTQYPNGTKGSGTSDASDYEQLSYDLNSNVTQYRARSGGTINFGYDNLDRVTSKTSSGVPSVNYAYDLLGRLTTATFATGGQGVTNSYDALNRLVWTETNVGGTAHRLTYGYDAASRRTRISWWDSFYVDYDRLVTGEISAVRQNGATSGAGLLATFGYDDLRRRTSVSRGNSVPTTYGYDAVSRLTSIAHDVPNSAYDLTITDTFNPAFQIVTETRSNDAFSFTAHANTNINYVANGLNQGKQADATVYGFDANGNITSDGWFTFTYDLENKLTSALPVNAGNRTLSYDPLNRLDTYNPGIARRFIYDGDEVAAELDSSGNIVARYVRGDAPDELLVGYNSADPTARGWYHLDQRGSVVAITDPNGTVTVVNRYDEYGQPQGGNYGTFQYTGQMWLGEIGVYNYKNRLYWPNERPGGRFLQTDPIGPVDSANLYQYALNDPVNNVDPSGLQQDSIIVTCGYCDRPFGYGFAGSGTSGNASGGFDLMAFVRRDIAVPAQLIPTPLLPNAPTCFAAGCDAGLVITGHRRNKPFVVIGGRYVYSGYQKPAYSNAVDYGVGAIVLLPVATIGLFEAVPDAVVLEGASAKVAFKNQGTLWQTRIFKNKLIIRKDLNQPITHYNIESHWFGQKIFNIHWPRW